MVDSWGQTVLKMMRGNDSHKTIYVIHDFSSSLNVLTPYVYHWQDRLAHATGNAKGYAAIILPRTTFARVARLLIVSRPPTLNPNLRLEVFYTREEGLEWLAQFLPE